MNSGKTSALIQVAHNYEERDMKVVVAKPKIDSKGKKQLVSRIGLKRSVDLLIDNKLDLSKQLGKFGKVDCVLIDEAQFLSPKQIDELFWYAVEKDTPVICYGLRTDFQTRGFPGASRLLELAHDLQEIKTVCRCGRKAVFNGRKLRGEFISTGDQVAIDGRDEIDYESLCAKCYKRYMP